MWMDNWVLHLPVHLWPQPPASALAHERVLFRFFETQTTAVVLSSSNKPEIEAHPELCAQRNVPILKRKGGGGTVVLGPGCLVLTFAFYASDIFGNSGYFLAINDIWAQALAAAGVANVETRGISDLAVGDRKIAGTSIFRRKHLLVYQGSLLVNPNFELMSELLAHPSREPDYRVGRSHSGFLTSTQREGCALSATELALHCQSFFEQNAHRILGDSFAGPETMAPIELVSRIPVI